jgi:formylglycine-generating enzyme required for sulfatase activity
MMSTRKKLFARRLLLSLFLLFGVNGLSQNVNNDLPLAGKPWVVPLADNTSLPILWISPGTFEMGSPVTEQGRKPDESPQHKVTITKGYWLGKTEVTIGQWKAIMGESLRDHVIKMIKDETVYDFGGKQQKLREYMHFDANDPDKIIANEEETLPMYFVSWNDAIAFCQKLTSFERSMNRLPKGYEYTLPTEAQWEYACRAGTTASTYAGSFENSSIMLDSICWYSGNSEIGYHGKKIGNSLAGPRKAGEKLPNAWGLFDMSGNLWEWCSDWYTAYNESAADPSGPLAGSSKVNRGGSWGSGPNDQRSAARAQNPPAEKSAYRGFRVALRVLE